MVEGLIIPESSQITVPHKRIHEIVESARPYYKNDGSMRFHGFGHPVDTTNHFLPNWVICAERGYVTDLEAGVGATAHHDDKFDEPLEGSGFDYKEKRSAETAEPELIKIEFTPTQICLSKGSIEATRAGALCTNLLDIQVVRADLYNTGQPYPYFLKFFMNFSKEQRMLCGSFMPFEEVKEITIEKLSLYYDQDLRYPFEAECPVTVQGTANLAQLKEHDEATVSAIAGEDFKAA